MELLSSHLVSCIMKDQPSCIRLVATVHAQLFITDNPIYGVGMLKYDWLKIDEKR